MGLAWFCGHPNLELGVQLDVGSPSAPILSHLISYGHGNLGKSHLPPGFRCGALNDRDAGFSRSGVADRLSVGFLRKHITLDMSHIVQHEAITT